ncbi:MAG: cytochrome c [bacterium]|nr:cytochrome c [bacterium]
MFLVWKFRHLASRGLPARWQTATRAAAFRALIVVGSLLTMAVGCNRQQPSFEPNRVLAKRLELSESVPMEQATADVGQALEVLFGTPDTPKWPEFLDGEQPLISRERLARAGGAVSSDEEGRHFGLFREHCVSCHGTNGDGLGPTAALLNPYPRDFRLGKFKFKSTPIGSKPTRDDLKQLLLRGVVGTSMPSFSLLEDEDLEALTDYVIYLSIRGELERRLLNEAALELDFDGGERVFDEAAKESDPELYAEQMLHIQSQTQRIAKQWSEAESQVVAIEGPPAELPVGRWVDLRAAESINLSQMPDALEQSIARGKQLFQGNVASCAFCHGPEGAGDGQQNNYDEWTRDWTLGFDPRDPEALSPMLEEGALKPRNILPRNLRLGVFRGGSSPADLYRRIVFGIEGTPMPALPMKPDNPQGLTANQVWDIVNYLLNLSDDSLSTATTSDLEGSSQAKNG